MKYEVNQKEAVSKVEDSLLLFGYLMERCMRLSNSQSLHFAFETAPHYILLLFTVIQQQCRLMNLPKHFHLQLSSSQTTYSL